MPTDPITRVLIDSMEGDAVIGVTLFQIRKDFDEQTSQIITRLRGIKLKGIIEQVRELRSATGLIDNISLSPFIGW